MRGAAYDPFKRAFDFVAASILLVVTSPIQAAVAVLVHRKLGSPVLFRQERPGKNEQIFELAKFRTMLDVDEEAGLVTDEQRLTKFGALLRSTSLDELPTLWNVIKGDMSLVGPRPHALGSLAGDSLFWEVTDNYWLRHAFKPGLTGLAQIRGFRGATEKREDLECRLRADLEYATNWSPWLDFLILLKTARVLVHSNAY